MMGFARWDLNAFMGIRISSHDDGDEIFRLHFERFKVNYKFEVKSAESFCVDDYVFGWEFEDLLQMKWKIDYDREFPLIREKT